MLERQGQGKGLVRAFDGSGLHILLVRPSWKPPGDPFPHRRRLLTPPPRCRSRTARGSRFAAPTLRLSTPPPLYCPAQRNGPWPLYADSAFLARISPPAARGNPVASTRPGVRMNVRPLHDRLFVTRIEDGEQTIGGII